MVPLLGRTDPLPSPESALREPNGLLAAGGGLSVPRLIDAYSRGVFPWFSDGDPVLWWCPNPRLILPTGAVHVSRSLARRLSRDDYRVTIDAAFGDVMRACAAPRADDQGTWITDEMVAAYEALHAAGSAHSLEIRRNPSGRSSRWSPRRRRRSSSGTGSRVLVSVDAWSRIPKTSRKPLYVDSSLAGPFQLTPPPRRRDQPRKGP